MAPEPLTHSVYIAAEPERVYDYFTPTRRDSSAGWGTYAQLDPRPGGAFVLDIKRRAPSAGATSSLEPARGGS